MRIRISTSSDRQDPSKNVLMQHWPQRSTHSSLVIPATTRLLEEVATQRAAQQRIGVHVGDEHLRDEEDSHDSAAASAISRQMSSIERVMLHFG